MSNPKKTVEILKDNISLNLFEFIFTVYPS